MFLTFGRTELNVFKLTLFFSFIELTFFFFIQNKPQRFRDWNEDMKVLSCESLLEIKLDLSVIYKVNLTQKEKRLCRIRLQPHSFINLFVYVLCISWFEYRTLCLCEDHEAPQTSLEFNLNLDGFLFVANVNICSVFHHNI